MSYQSTLHHPDHGELFNLTESAKYLGISRRKFRRIAPGPDLMQDKVYPFWSRRILDILTVKDDFVVKETLHNGKRCGEYLIGDMTDEEIRTLRDRVIAVQFGGPPKSHTCGYEEADAGLDLFQTAQWLNKNCDCPGRSPSEETSRVLEQYESRITFSCDSEAKVYRDGILSAIKDHVTAQVSTMEMDEARRYIMEFWGGGSYEGLLIGHRSDPRM